MAILSSMAGIATARTPERWTRARVADLALLVGVYFVVAAACFNGFYDKWGFRDDDAKFSFAAMIDGTAERPYVYRQLVPALVNGAQALLPDSAVSALTEALYRADNGELKSKLTSPQARDPQYALRYHMFYYGTFLFLLASLFVMRAMCLAAGFDLLVATLSPAIFVLFVPFLQSAGGYFYDFSEILFMATAVLLSLKGRTLWLLPLAVVATWNKEAFLFFLVTLYPIVRTRKPELESGVIVGAAAVVALVTYLVVRLPFADNPGATAQVHALDNLLYYANPLNLLERDVTYGLKTMHGYSIVSLVLVGIIVTRGWNYVSAAIRRHVVLAAAINLPLLLLFCAPGELRNLSLLYMGAVLLLAGTLSEIVARAGGRGPGAARGPY